eukprot:CAMPEP_0113847576 /NCGR_PEP_ID=MMETSP0372-20130328/1956_1 /TAXON_ID=340204 /ORGANISM="Lankesteria abbotti" /LENGTH=509 /DNA_ID=CAMNT_0000816879 /DNA_START=114 /DNA_END=1643 /DNA_ORIENTATION=+ /assembly_acc=CAM_ASM_000359
MTHVQYAFMAPDENCEMQTVDFEADYGGTGWTMPCEIECGVPSGPQGPNRGNVGCLKKVRDATGAKLGLSLGGWTLSTDFSHCFANRFTRQKFVGVVVDKVNSDGYDFIDIDYEYPYGGGNDDKDGVMHGLPNDWDYFKDFVTELRSAFSSGGLSHVEISGAFGMNPNLIRGTPPYTQPTPMKWLCDNLEIVMLMSYDLMGGWVAPTGWPAPAYYDPAATYEYAEELNIDWQLKQWKNACGANFDKVVLGLPAYGKSWRNVGPGADGTGMYQNCTYDGDGPEAYPDFPCLGDGSFTDQPGTLEIWDITMNYLSDSRCTHYFNDVAKTDFVYCPGKMFMASGAPDIWFSYDSTESFFEKVKMAKDMGAGGWMFWEPGYTLVGDFQTSVMDPAKAAVFDTNKDSFFPKYLWSPYEDACFDAWNGGSVDDHRSDGIRIGGGTATIAPTSGPFSCDEVSAASVPDNSVESSCLIAFCTMACNTFMAGTCASDADAATCVTQQINAAASVSCSF